MLHRRFCFVMTCLIVLMGLSACGTSVKTGVRDTYKEKTRALKAVTLTPFYSVGTFGYTKPEYDAMMALYQKAATQWLTRKGYNVTDARAFEQQLTEAGSWKLFQEGVALTRSLNEYFERDPSVVRVEIATLKTLAAQKKLPATALLFGEVLYHSDATCQAPAKEYTGYASTKTHTGAPKSYPKPCVTSHIHTKLVDPQTGLTMWYNRAMSEHYVPTFDAKYTWAAISMAIAQMLGGDDGLK